MKLVMICLRTVNPYDDQKLGNKRLAEVHLIEVLLNSHGVVHVRSFG